IRGVLGNLLATATATIFNDDYVNHPPLLSLGGPYVVSEWGSVDLLFTATDPDPLNSSLRFEMDLDYDGVTFDAGTFFSHITPQVLGWDGPSSHTIAARVIDEKGAVSNITTTTVNVQNLAPAVFVGADRLVTEGTTVVVPGQYFHTDPVTFRWHLVSTTSGQTVADQTTPDLVFTADGGSYTWELTVTDDDGASFSDSLVVTALNIRPRVTVQPQTVVEGSTVHMISTV